MDERTPVARAVLVVNGEIVALSDNPDEYSEHPVYRHATINRSFENDVLMPGFIDPHLHPLMAAVILPMAFITPEDWSLPRGVFTGVQSPDAYQTRLRQLYAKFDDTNETDYPFFSWGWHPLWHGEINRAWLSKLAPDRPVFIWHRSFHEILTNDAGMRLLGYSNQSEFELALQQAGANPEHGDYAAGLFSETATTIALPALGRYLLAPTHLDQGFKDLLAMMRSAGVTTIADMATGIFANFDAEALILANVFEQESVPARVLLVPVASNMSQRAGSIDAAVNSMRKREQSWPYTKLLLNNRFKLFADGAFFSQLMQMREPGYLDGHEGRWLTEPDQLLEQASALWNESYSLHIHVNGDAGLDSVLEALVKIDSANGRDQQRVTLEHLGYSAPDQTKRIADLKAAVSAQPNYLYVLSEKFAQYGLGSERAHAMNRLGSLSKAGVRLALHSDLTMAPVDPLFLAWIATNRKDQSGTTLSPDEQLSLHDGLRAITIDAAYAIGLEHQIGSISPGKRADFTALNKDPYDVGASELRSLTVKGLVFSGGVFKLELD
ncbi:MAG: amidohydrolase [Pseudomonadota bacterium]